MKQIDGQHPLKKIGIFLKKILDKVVARLYKNDTESFALKTTSRGEGR